MVKFGTTLVIIEEVHDRYMKEAQPLELSLSIVMVIIIHGCADVESWTHITQQTEKAGDKRKS